MRAKFPFYKADGKPILLLNDIQNKAVKDVISKIATSEYKLKPILCLCGSDGDGDVVVSEKDRFGFTLPQILCSKCGLIRSGENFDENSLIKFYKNEYRAIYSSQKNIPTEYFMAQCRRGKAFSMLMKTHISLDHDAAICEIGCGAGGILQSVKEAGWSNILGVDFGAAYVDYGISKGLNLRCGDYSEVVEDNSQDLIILSHVMEHFLDPVREMINVLEKVSPSGYLLVEVPSIESIPDYTFELIDYFQNAHIYNFHKKFLDVFFRKLGLDVKYGDERSTFILQKPMNWKKPDKAVLRGIYSDELCGESERIKKIIIQYYNEKRFNINFWKRKLYPILIANPALRKSLSYMKGRLVG